MACRHREDAYVLFYYYYPTVFIYNLDKLVLEIALALMAANAYCVAGLQWGVKLCDYLAVDSDSMSLQYGLGLGAAFAYSIEKVFKQRGWLATIESVQSTVRVASLYTRTISCVVFI